MFQPIIGKQNKASVPITLPVPTELTGISKGFPIFLGMPSAGARP